MSRQRKRKEDAIFFLVLVDLLIQFLFLGLVLYSANAEETLKQANLSNSAKASLEQKGIKNPFDLVEKVVRLVPAEDLLPAAWLINQNGGVTQAAEKLNELQSIKNAFAALGPSAPAVTEVVAAYRKLTEQGKGGTNLPNCIEPAKLPYVTVAEVHGSKDTIEVVSADMTFFSLASGIDSEQTSFRREDFGRMFSAYHKMPQYKSCRFAVAYKSVDDSDSARREVEKAFYVRHLPSN